MNAPQDARLRSLPSTRNVKPEFLPPFQFRDMKGWFLLTNDWGFYAMLETKDFNDFMSGDIAPDHPLWPDLQRKGFVRSAMDFSGIAVAYQKRNSFWRSLGPGLHMMVVTLRCNQKCHYCHSSVVDPSRTDTDMDIETAKNVVDFIFKTPNPTLCIEFQGGEPLLNWPVVKFVTQYARLKAKAQGRKLIIALVSNFTLMSEEKLNFLFDHQVSLCTSLDGPPDIHNKNRPFLGSGAAQNQVISWLLKIQKRCENKNGKNAYLPGALMTTTRFSLGRGKEIVDTYAALGLEQIFLRPLSPIGYAKRVWGEIGYDPQDFSRFYEETLDYILDLNKKGSSSIMERMALVLLTKILKGEDPGYMDLRSPSGAVLGCLAYNYNGDVFVSDEGRMVDHQGDSIFCVGNAARDDWQSVLEHPTSKACATASVIEGQPLCFQCVYKPYCGVDPVFHYETQKNIAGHLPSSSWCVSHMGIFDVVFRKLRDAENRKIFESWLKRDQCRWQENDPPSPALTGELPQ